MYILDVVQHTKSGNVVAPVLTRRTDRGMILVQNDILEMK